MESTLYNAFKKLTASLEIKLVNITLCKCSWDVLSILGILLMVSTKVCQKPREYSKFTSLKTCRARLVSQAGIAKIDQLAEKLRQRGFRCLY